MYIIAIMRKRNLAWVIKMNNNNDNQSRSKLDFSHLQDFPFDKKFDSIIRNLEPLSVQYAWKMSRNVVTLKNAA